jgi:hypothetical protein
MKKHCSRGPAIAPRVSTTEPCDACGNATNRHGGAVFHTRARHATPHPTQLTRDCCGARTACAG